MTPKGTFTPVLFLSLGLFSIASFSSVSLVQCLSDTYAYQSPPFAGTGPRQVDMNVYNLHPAVELIETQWTANIVRKTVDDEGGVRLGVRNDREYFVDELSIDLPRPENDGGLGIVLREIAGGREDGLGITLVAGLVEGGHAERSGIDLLLPGDSLAEVSVVTERRTGTSDERTVVAVTTECLGYDATVGAIGGLPDDDDGDRSFSVFRLRVKRLRRKPKVRVELSYADDRADETLELFAGENLRFGALVRGSSLNDETAQRFDTRTGGNCGAGGLCRTCAVDVVQGGDLLSPQRVAEKQMLADNPRWRLACKAFVGHGMKEGVLKVRVAPRKW